MLLLLPSFGRGDSVSDRDRNLRKREFLRYWIAMSTNTCTRQQTASARESQVTGDTIFLSTGYGDMKRDDGIKRANRIPMPNRNRET